MKLIFDKQANSVTEKVDVKKYREEGEKGKLEYPKPEKHKKNEYISESELKSDLEFPTKKEASVGTEVKEKDIRYPGEKEKLEHNKKVEFPTEGEADIVSDSKTSKKYIGEGDKGDIEKNKSLSTDMLSGEKPKNYYLKFDTAKPFQKQFSKEEFLTKNAGKSFEDWMKTLKEKGVSRKARRKFQHIWKSSLAQGKDEEYAARAAIDSLPKDALDKPTSVHGPEKSGPVKEAAVVPIEDIIGYTMASLIKFSKECPDQFTQLVSSLNIQPYKEVVKSSLQVSADINEDISRKQEEIQKAQEQLAKLQNDLSELQKKQSEQTASQAK